MREAKRAHQLERPRRATTRRASLDLGATRCLVDAAAAAPVDERARRPRRARSRATTLAAKAAAADAAGRARRLPGLRGGRARRSSTPTTGARSTTARARRLGRLDAGDAAAPTSDDEQAAGDLARAAAAPRPARRCSARARPTSRLRRPPHLVGFVRDARRRSVTRWPPAVRRTRLGQTRIALPDGRWTDVLSGVTPSTARPRRRAELFDRRCRWPCWSRSSAVDERSASGHPTRRDVGRRCCIDGRARVDACRMQRTEDGWWELDARRAAGDALRVRLDGGEPLADPRALRLPGRPRRLRPRSSTSTTFAWTDDAWRGVPLPGAVIYELHVGTFTPEGTLDAAIERLDHLVELGVDLVELMPLATFPGRHGWGYDGVGLYAVHEPYGGPDGARAVRRRLPRARPRRLPRRRLQPPRPERQPPQRVRAVLHRPLRHPVGRRRSTSTAPTATRCAASSSTTR